MKKIFMFKTYRTVNIITSKIERFRRMSAVTEVKSEAVSRDGILIQMIQAVSLSCLKSNSTPCE